MTSYVLVHGGFSDGWYWGETAALLEKEGHRVDVAHLPSAGTDPTALGDLTDDLAEVRRLVDEAGEPVVLVGHSSGGVVVTELAGHAAVAHTVYLGAFWPERGQTVLDLLNGNPLPSYMSLRADGTAEITDADAACAGLCAELDPSRLAEWSAHNVLSSTTSLTTPSTAPDRTHPTTYVVLQRDEIIPPAAQEAMAARADEVARMDTSHQAMLADPAGLTAILTRLARP